MFGLSKRVWMVIGGVVLVLVLIGLARSRGAGADADVGSGSCRFTVTADALNVRDAPGLQGAVVRQLPQGTTVAAEQTVRHGYREIKPDRWVAQRFLKPAGGKCGQGGG